MQLNWLYTTLLSVIWFAAQTSAQYTSSSDYAPPPPTYVPPGYGSPTTVTVTSISATTLTSLTTTTTTTTLYSQAPYGYDNSYIPPIKKKTGLIIGLVVGLCGLAIILLVVLLLRRKKKHPKVVDYGPKDTTYGKDTTPATGY